jgi:hypothetical protein
MRFLRFFKSMKMKLFLSGRKYGKIVTDSLFGDIFAIDGFLLTKQMFAQAIMVFRRFENHAAGSESLKNSATDKTEPCLQRKCFMKIVITGFNGFLGHNVQNVHKMIRMRKQVMRMDPDVWLVCLVYAAMINFGSTL